MATRKKRVLTPEERLEAALVPKEEWPYEVPDNWCWVQGAGLFKPMKSAAPTGESFRYIDIESIDNHKQEVSEPKVMPVDKAPSRARRKLTTGDTVFSTVRPYLKNIAYIDESLDGCIASTGFYVCSPVEYLDGRYLYYLMCSGYVVGGLNAFMKGDNSPSIRSGDVERFPFPLPPLHEQRRIASRIEWLFAKLDDAEAELREVIGSSEQRQAAILHKAFSGELSLHGDDSSQAWSRIPVGTIVSGLKYGTSEKSTYDNDGMPVLRIPNVSSLHVDLNDMKYLSHSNVKPTDMLQEGDILMIRSNGSRDLVGRCAVVPALDEVYTYASFLIRVRPSDKVDPYYLWYFLQSPDAKAQLFTKAKSSSGIHNINSKEIGATIMPLPSLDEQHEIVSKLDAFFDGENKARAEATKALNIMHMVRESILSQALRGELGTNEPDEPSSEELLASIASGNAGRQKARGE